MNPNYPIFVISKGRPNSCLTARELLEMGVPFRIVVEPHEYDAYAASYPAADIITTPFQNLGLGSIPVRNHVKQLAKDEGHLRHWILDDNIEGFHRLHQNEKYKVGDGTIFKCCEDFTDRYKNVVISGMNYHSFCKTGDAVPPFYLNTRVYSCILLDTNCKHDWRGRFNEDTDLSLRVLKDGDCTVLFNAFLCGKVTTMRMKGGNTDEVYLETDNRLEFARSLAEQHPDCVKVVWKFGRWHHSVDYKRFKKNKLVKKSGEWSGVNNYGMKLSNNMLAR